MCWKMTRLAPRPSLCHHFVLGDIRDFDAVYQFGKQVDALTIEVESVNVDALERLEAEGVKIYPTPAALRTLKNKGPSKALLQDKEIPTAPFVVLEGKRAFPGGARSRTARRAEDRRRRATTAAVYRSFADPNDFALEKVSTHPPSLEKLIQIKKEIARDRRHRRPYGAITAIYPATEMVFHPELNLLDYQVCPADIPRETLWKAEALAMMVVKGLASPGIFAVELFLDNRGDVWVNETAPRVHNSGHHTIEASYCSQFDMLWRILLGYPLGNPEMRQPSALLNVVGARGYEGPVRYEGLDDVLKMSNTFVHLYGKEVTKPGRKMGHITFTGKDRQELVYQAGVIKRLFQVVS